MSVCISFILLFYTLSQYCSSIIMLYQMRHLEYIIYICHTNIILTDWLIQWLIFFLCTIIINNRQLLFYVSSFFLSNSSAVSMSTCTHSNICAHTHTRTLTHTHARTLTHTQSYYCSHLSDHQHDDSTQQRYDNFCHSDLDTAFLLQEVLP